MKAILFLALGVIIGGLGFIRALNGFIAFNRFGGSGYLFSIITGLLMVGVAIFLFKIRKK